MKRGIPIALQAAGAVLACLVTILNHPVIAQQQSVPMRDTAYYYNEQGTEIFCEPNADSPGVYVVKTSKKRKVIFYDYDRARAQKDYERAQVRCISNKRAKRVEALIVNGMIKKTIVRKSIVKILSKNIFRRMLDSIPDSGKNSDSLKDCLEYGGVVENETAFTCLKGNWSNVCDSGTFVELPPNKEVYYHSHPSCEKISCNGYYIQGPSMVDQKAVTNAMSYVFGMNIRSHLLYVYNKRGVQATLPFCWILCDSVNK